MDKKFKTGAGLGTKVAEERAFAKRQQFLKKRHGIRDEDVIVVEKPSFTKWLLTMLIRLIKVSFTISLLILAVLGLVSLVYPLPRQALVAVLTGIYMEVQYLLGM